MKLYIRYHGQNLELETEQNGSVDDIQSEIYRLTGIEPYKQKISFLSSGNQVVIPQSSKFSFYNIKDQSLLFLDEMHEELENPQSPDIKITRRYSHRIPEVSPIYSEKNTHRKMSCYDVNETKGIEEWVAKIVICSREGNLDSFLETLQEYQNWKGMRLREEDVGDLLNWHYNQQWSCIHYACYMNHFSVLKEILELGANCNNITNDHWTPLQITAYQGNYECLEMLLAHPLLQIDLMTPIRGSALHLAVIRNNFQIVKALVENSASLTLRDPSGKAPVELANDQSIHEYLQKKLSSQSVGSFFGIEEQEKPLVFSGEVWCISSWHINDMLVFLVLDSEKGKFTHYDERDGYIDGNPPELLIPFKDINKVVMQHSENKFYFNIMTNDITLRYYTLYQDMTEEWTRRVDWCLKYFHHQAKLSRSHKFQSPKKILLKSESKIIYEEEPYEDIGESLIKKSSFDIIGELGAGSFGNVYQVRKKDSGEIFAMKALSKPMLISKSQLKYATAECKILKAIRHPFIVRLYWAFQSQSYLYMVLEYCPNGDFSNLLALVTNLSVEVSRFYTAEMVLAIEYLHSIDVIYRDLKPQNILLDAEGHIKLTDFGLSKENASEEEPAMSFCGSPAYLAPEVLAKTGSWKPADIYNIGTNLYEMLVGKPPYFTENLAKLYKRISKGSLTFPDNIDQDARDLIEKVMSRNPDDRPTIIQVKSHRFFKAINWDDMVNKKIPPPINVKNLRNLRSSRIIA